MNKNISEINFMHTYQMVKYFFAFFESVKKTDTFNIGDNDSGLAVLKSG